MIMALKFGPYSDSLCKKLPTTLDMLGARAVKFIQMEEITKFRKKMRGKSSRKPIGREVKIKSSHSLGKSKANMPPQSKFSDYTLLIESQGRVLEEACSNKLIQVSAKN